MNHRLQDDRDFDWLAFWITLVLVLIIAAFILGCGQPPAQAQDGSYNPAFVQKTLEANNVLLGQVEDLTDTLDEYKLAARIQGYYAKQGMNKSFNLIQESVHQSFDVAEFYVVHVQLPKELNCYTLAYYLLTFASFESDFNPMLVGKKGDSGICQVLKKDFPRLARRARTRGIEFKEEQKNIRAGLIVCLEEYLEKIQLAKGDVIDGIWMYNGSRTYLKPWKKRYKIIRYGEDK